MIVKVKAGFTKDGKLLALHSDVTDDTGSYAFSGSPKDGTYGRIYAIDV